MGEQRARDRSIPEVSNLSEVAAVDALESAEFVVVIEEEPSETVREGNAIRTEPEIEAELGETVTLSSVWATW